jgi:uncharacterized protein YjdB
MTKKQNIYLFGTVCIGALLILALIGCPQPTSSSKTIRVTGVTIQAGGTDITSYALWAPGDTESSHPKSVKLDAAVSPANASNKKVTWDTSDTANAVVALDANGNVTAIAAGTATITVTTQDGSHKATCQITVHAAGEQIVPVTGAAININGSPAGESFSMEAGTNIQLEALVSPAEATDKTVTWSSGDTGVASVNNEGSLSAHTAGNAAITLTTNGKKADGSSATASFALTVTSPSAEYDPVEDLAVTPASLSFTAGGGPQTLAAVVSPVTARQSVNWNSTNTAVVTVADGQVSPAGAGTAEIVVTTVGQNAQGSAVEKRIPVTVEPALVPATPVTGVSILIGGGGGTPNLTSYSMEAGTNAAIHAVVLPAEADQTVSWEFSSASAESVAAVSAGVLAAHNAGTVTVTARTNGKDAAGNSLSASFVLTVEPSAVQYDPVTALNISPQSVTLYVGGASQTVSAGVLPATARQGIIVEENTNAAAVSVTAAEGGFTLAPIAAGTALITLETEGQDSGGQAKTAAVTVSVLQPVSSLAIQKDSGTVNSLTLTKGDNISLSALVLPADAHDTGVTWSSNNNTIADIDSDGSLDAINEGTTTITATSKGKNVSGAAITASITVTVSVPKISQVELDRSAFSFILGGSGFKYPASGTVKLNATAYPSSASAEDRVINWQSDNESVATVAADGTVTLTASASGGQAIISATAAGLNDSGQPVAATAIIKADPLALAVYNQKAGGELDAATTRTLPSPDANGRYVIKNHDGGLITEGTSGKADGVNNSTVLHLNAPLNSAFTITARVRIAELNGGPRGATTAVMMGALAPTLDISATDKPGSFSAVNEGIRFAALRVGSNAQKRIYASRASAANTSTPMSIDDTGNEDNWYREYILKLEKQTGGNYPHIATVYESTGVQKGNSATYNNNALSSTLKGDSLVYPGFVIAGVSAEIAEITITDNNGIIFSTPSVSPAPTPVHSITGFSSVPAASPGGANDTDHFATFASVKTNGVQLTPALKPADGDISGGFTWTVESGTNISVSSSGKVTFQEGNSGVSVIKAALTANPAVSKTFTFDIDDSTVPATGVSITGADARYVKKGETLALSATVEPAAQVSQAVSWKLSTANDNPDAGTPSFAAVDGSGLVSASGFGTCYAYAVTTEAQNESGQYLTSAPVTITVSPVASVTLNAAGSANQLAKQGTLQMTAVLTLTAGGTSDGTVIWSVTDTSAYSKTTSSNLASINGSGLVTANSNAGKVWVWATSEDGEAGDVYSAGYAVEIALARTVTISGDGSSVKNDESDAVTLSAAVLPAFAEQPVTWKLSTAAAWDSGATAATAAAYVTTSEDNGVLTVKGKTEGTGEDIYVYAVWGDGTSYEQVSAGKKISVKDADVPAFEWKALAIGSTITSTSKTLDGNDKITLSATNGTSGTGGLNLKKYADMKEMYLIYIPINGDFEFIVKASNISMSGTNELDRIGIIAIKKNGDETEPIVPMSHFVAMTKGANATDARWSKRDGDTSGDIELIQSPSSNRPSLADGGYFKLIRNGANFYGYSSADGISWSGLNATTANYQTSNFGENTLYLGIIVTAREKSPKTSTVKYEEVTLKHGDGLSETYTADFSNLFE